MKIFAFDFHYNERKFWFFWLWVKFTFQPTYWRPMLMYEGVRSDAFVTDREIAVSIVCINK